MNGLAHLALDAGFQVAGSDLQAKPALEALKARGAEVSIGIRSGIWNRSSLN
jgi:UDP-N-acetylmuramate-alanine ligase